MKVGRVERRGDWVERIEAKVRRVERKPDGKDGSKGWEGGEETGWKRWK